MNIPILRKTVTLANLAAATVAVRAVLTLDERRVDASTALRRLQCFGNLLFRAEHNPIVDVRDSSVFACLVNRRINQIFCRHVKCTTRSSRQSRRRWNVPLTERFQNRLFIRFVFVTGNQSWSLVFQAFRRVAYQQLRVLFRAFAVDDFQHEFVFGVNANVIPIVAAAHISGIVFVAMLFLFLDEVPLLVELNLLRVRGKNRPTRRGVLRRVHRQVACNGLRCRDQRSANALSSAFQSLRQRVREWKQRYLWVNAHRKKPYRDARKSVLYKSNNTTTVLSCSGRT